MSSVTAAAVPPARSDHPKPTEEQAAIIDACAAGTNVVVLAGAGSGGPRR